MALEPVPPDNWAPLEIGYRFRLGNSDEAGQWVVIYDIDSKYVYARGIDGHIADLKIPRWKFDDVVSDHTVESDAGGIQGIMGIAPPED